MLEPKFVIGYLVVGWAMSVITPPLLGFRWRDGELAMFFLICLIWPVSLFLVVITLAENTADRVRFWWASREKSRTYWFMGPWREK
jgi:hypothetical protein